MRYKIRKFIGEEAEREGWKITERAGQIEIINDAEKIEVRFEGENVKTGVEGKGQILIIRNNKVARLPKKSEGRIENGDSIWLLNHEATEEYNRGERNNFGGAGAIIEVLNEEMEKKQEIYVKEKASFSEKKNISVNMILGGIVFILLIVGTILGYQKRTEKEQDKKFEEISNGVKAKITEIESVRSVDIETALQLAQDAESIINNPGVAEKKYNLELAELSNEIIDIKKSLGGKDVEYEIAYDTGLIKEGEDIFKGMAVKNNLAYLWSVNLGQINVVDPSLRSNEMVVSDERIKNWLGVFSDGKKWYGYDQNKIFEIKRNELVETEIKNVQSVGEMTGWNGLTYMIDNKSKNIIKLSDGEGKNWLNEGVTLSEEATGISIDSSIWVLGKTGRIYHYNLGREEKFEMVALTSLNEAKYLKTSDEVDFLAYVADENIVVIYGKDGKILGKFSFPDTKINDIGIEVQNNAVLVLAKNGKIYRIKINEILQ